MRLNIHFHKSYFLSIGTYEETPNKEAPFINKFHAKAYLKYLNTQMYYDNITEIEEDNNLYYLKRKDHSGNSVYITLTSSTFSERIIFKILGFIVPNKFL